MDYENELGKIYGCYKILKFFPYDKKKKRQCLCECQICKAIRVVGYDHLKRRLYKDCPNCKPKPKLKFDLTGQRFGKLTVLERVENHIQQNGSSKVSYKCLCDCGNTCIVQSSHLRTQHTTSCGCFLSKQTREAHLKDITGRRYGKLTAVERIWINNKPYWRCVCDCGGEKISEVRYLNNGKVNSCGCLISSAEEQMKNILLSKNLLFKQEYKFEGCKDKRRLPFDFAILDKKENVVMLIELQGEQHYHPFTFNSESKEIKNKNLEDRIKKDNIKRNFCADNNIPLLEIRYTQFHKMEKIFEEFYNNLSVR